MAAIAYDVQLQDPRSVTNSAKSLNFQMKGTNDDDEPDLSGSFRRLRSADSSDSPSGGPRTGHSDSEDGGALGWTVLASSASHSAGRAGLSGQRVPSGVGNAGHACDSLQAAAAVVGAKSPGHPAGLGLLREHGDRAVPPPRSGRPEWIHT